MAYTKLDHGITNSTIWQAPDTTRLVWITMLSMADQNGYVGASMPGLAGRARVDLAACIAAIDMLKSPDEWSRTKTHEGRRIADADGGWVLLNHAKYRAEQNADDRRERSRLAMATLRSARKQVLTVNNVSIGCSKLAQEEAEEETKEEEVKPKRESTSPPRAAVASPHSRGSRLPTDWTPEPEHMAFAESLGLRNGRAGGELEKFRDYWIAQPGQKGVKTNWAATWRNWVRRATESIPGKPGSSGAMDMDGIL